MDAKTKSLIFRGGKLSKATAPHWFRVATAKDGDFDEVLSQAGATGVDDYGDAGDTIKIFRTPNGGHLVAFWDTSEIISLVFIDDLVDFMLFKAQFIAPMAQLIIASDQHWAWQEDRKKKRS